TAANVVQSPFDHRQRNAKPCQAARARSSKVVKNPRLPRLHMRVERLLDARERTAETAAGAERENMVFRADYDRHVVDNGERLSAQRYVVRFFVFRPPA